MTPPTICWRAKERPHGLPGAAELIDQTLLPNELRVLSIETPEQMWEAIRLLRVRGAPAIGIAAGFGLVLGVQHSRSVEELEQRLSSVDAYLRTSRPTAVNLFWALDRMRARARRDAALDLGARKTGLLEEAQTILEQDRDTCRRIGRHGAELVKNQAGILTHCNAGGLATAEYGTALAVCYAAKEAGKTIHVYADETRPLLQGARLTAFELLEAGVDVTLICDNMAGVVLRQKKVDLVVVGADRIAANGDTANKIGTYSVAVLARAHGVPFYVAAPMSTFDLGLDSGERIPIEERPGEEITEGFGRRSAPRGVKTYNPAFDVTPHDLIRAIITEHGLIEAPDARKVAEFFARHVPTHRAASG